ncbi:hypothetical protein J2857_005308 [Neorhizobium galegae]|uniref:hypothetical protein n=1 Tax=Neorhizobium galegae TaxID=399 RepID=UPI001AE379ED|nr:hypothetical protein [Neorhizobium galegae]MBP2562517.1 hypothetical protein [Neorhizobium galegae]
MEHHGTLSEQAAYELLGFFTLTAEAVLSLVKTDGTPLDIAVRRSLMLSGYIAFCRYHR